MTRVLALALLILMTAVPVTANGLKIYFIDVEGGQATLITTPAGESLLIDTGRARPAVDPDRVLAALRDAGLTRLDYLLLTHFHSDHAGGISELAAHVPIGTFIDYGEPLGGVYGVDRSSARNFSTYLPLRDKGRHLHPRPGEHLAVAGLDIEVVSSAGKVLETPLAGAGRLTEACATINEHPEDGTENFRSLGVVVRFGAFTLVDLGDLSGNTLSKLICPRNLIGDAAVYLIAHHGNYDTDSRAIYEAMQPRVAVMNNGPTKGGDPAVFRTLHAVPSVDLWQLHASRHPGAINTRDDRIANLDDEHCPGHWITIEASADGSFIVANGRTGSTTMYPRPATTRSDVQP